MDIQQFIAVFLAICGGIITVSGAIGWIIKWVQAAKKPSDDLQALTDQDLYGRERRRNL